MIHHIVKYIQIIAGFVLLFLLYHGAEYFVIFQYHPLAFLCIQIAFFTAAYVIARWQGYRGFSAWGLDISNGWLPSLLTGMAFGILLYAAVWLVNLVTGKEFIEQPPSVYEGLPRSSCSGLAISFLRSPKTSSQEVMFIATCLVKCRCCS